MKVYAHQYYQAKIYFIHSNVHLTNALHCVMNMLNVSRFNGMKQEAIVKHTIQSASNIYTSISRIHLLKWKEQVT